MNKTFPLYSSFSEEEQKGIFELIRKCVALSEQARREGILALEDGLNDLPKQVKGKCGLYIQLLLRLVVDGTDGETIRFIGDNYIVSSCETDFERLSFCVIEEGVLSIQCGDNPRILTQKLLSFTGHLDAEKYLPELGLDVILKFPEHVGEHDEDDKIVTHCADGEVIWQSEIDAILMGKPIEKTQSQKNPKCKTADSAEKDGD